MPKRVELEGDGPFVLPAAEAFLGLAIQGARLPVQIRFVLKGGFELHLPLEEAALEKMERQIAQLYLAKVAPKKS